MVRPAARAALAALALAACSGDRPAGPASTARDGGPRVVWDLEGDPLPEIPLPNDIATRLDPTSPTGRRVNVSLLAPTGLEEDLRVKANQLDGFGVYMPFTVPLDREPDLSDLKARQSDEDPGNDALLLVDVTPGSPTFGQRRPVSLGDGLFPYVLERTHAYFENDGRREAMNLLYEVVQEDRNCNGVLDPGEDTDFDGVLDRPNVLDLEFYEDANCNGVLDPGEDMDCDGVLDLNPAMVTPVHEDRNCNGALDPGEDLDCDGALDVDWPLTRQLHEDVNCNGVLDPGEDLDCDGTLDKVTDLIAEARGDANYNYVVDPGETWACDEVFLPRHDLRRAARDREITDHLLDFYERESDTLVARPALPLRQHTTYAVVLTRHLRDADGRPVESPFPFVGHATQRDALAPLGDLLPPLGYGLDDVAFAWTFTTGATTWELEQVRRGLYGAGPLAWLGARFPVETSLELQRIHDGDVPVANPYIATREQLREPLTILTAAGLLDDEVSGVDFLSHLIVGRFKSPDFLVDRDGLATEGAPADDDESFDLDATTGEAVVGDGYVTFYCLVPRTIPGVQEPPFPVQIYGHGYTFHRLEALATIGHFARFGMVTCALDAFGHGVSEGPGDVFPNAQGDLVPVSEFAVSFVHDEFGMGGLAAGILQARSRDLNNDGYKDSGGDYWTADTFHTRDVVRQSVIDHMQFIRILRSFDGVTRGNLDQDGDGTPDLLGDFDNDGVPDFGGPQGRYHMWGISLGGILSAVLGGIEPALDAVVPVSGGGGLIDVALRSVQPGVPQAVFLPLLGPLVSARPVAGEPGLTELRFVLNDINRTQPVPFLRTRALLPGDRVVLTNPRNGEEASLIVPADGRFRLAVPADALLATEQGPWLVPPPADAPAWRPPALRPPRRVARPDRVGDPLVLTVYDRATGALKATFDRFGLDATFQGATHPAGSPLVALQSGFGFHRNSPDLRRLLGIASMILQAADPIAYAPHYWRDPLDFSDYDPDVRPGANVLLVPTAGDMLVPVNTGIMLAAAAGTLSAEEPDPRFGRPALRQLADDHVLEAVERLDRWRVDVTRPDGSVDEERGLFDPDRLAQGLGPYDAPGYDPPLRATVRSADGGEPTRESRCEGDLCGTWWRAEGGLNAMRIPYLDYRGQHGFDLRTRPERDFDTDGYLMNVIAHFFRSGGTELPDDVCFARGTCPELPPETLEETP